MLRTMQPWEDHTFLKLSIQILKITTFCSFLYKIEPSYYNSNIFCCMWESVLFRSFVVAHIYHYSICILIFSTLTVYTSLISWARNYRVYSIHILYIAWQGNKAVPCCSWYILHAGHLNVASCSPCASVNYALMARIWIKISPQAH